MDHHHPFCMYRFGTHVSGVAPTNRTMRVNNTSPFGEISIYLLYTGTCISLFKCNVKFTSEKSIKNCLFFSFQSITKKNMYYAINPECGQIIHTSIE